MEYSHHHHQSLSQRSSTISPVDRSSSTLAHHPQWRLQLPQLHGHVASWRMDSSPSWQTSPPRTKACSRNVSCPSNRRRHRHRRPRTTQIDGRTGLMTFVGRGTARTEVKQNQTRGGGGGEEIERRYRARTRVEISALLLSESDSHTPTTRANIEGAR